MADEARVYDDARRFPSDEGVLRGLIVKPGRQYDLQPVQMFLGVPYAAPPVGSLRFMPPVSAPPWYGVKMATRFAPVCPQSLPQIKKGNPPSLGRQHYINRLKPFLKDESEDCLYLNVYLPYREQKSKKFPVLVFVHGDSFEWSSGNPYDGRILSSYGNVMVVTINYRLGILGFMKPSLTEHVYGNNGLLDQLAALQWIKDNIEDLNGDPTSVTLMGHGTGAACINFLMLSPISNGKIIRNKESSDTVPEVRDSAWADRSWFIYTQYQLLSGVTELESYHEFGVIELDHGILETQRDEFIRKYAKIVYDGAEDLALKEILKQYSPSKLDPQRWPVETNRDVILNMFSDARTLAPMIRLANYQSKANGQSYFYVFGHNSVSTEYAPLNKSVHGEEMPYVLGIPLGGAHTHFHAEYTEREKLLSEVVMRLWTNFVKNGSPNTQSVNEYQTLDKKVWNQYNVEWPEYNSVHQPYLRIDTVRKIWSPPVINQPHYSETAFGKLRPYSPPQHKSDTDAIYREIQSIKTPSRPIPPSLMEKTALTTAKPTINMAIKTSSMTVTLIISLSILFLAVNISICSVLYLRKKKLQRDRSLQCTRPSRAEMGEVDVIGQKSSKDDKSTLQKLKNGCSVIRAMSNKMPKNSKKVKTKEVCKTPKSDDSGGFRERFQLRRHLSTSTLDAHTKVKDWIANEVMHRCSPNILRKSNSETQQKSVKQYTRSEELLTESQKLNKTSEKLDKQPLNSLSNKFSLKNKTSEKTTSTSALDSQSSIISNNKTEKSNDSLKSKESVKSKKVSVAVDATPSARTNSIFSQEPIEHSKSVDDVGINPDYIDGKIKDIVKNNKEIPVSVHICKSQSDNVFKNELTLSLKPETTTLKISHKHSTSDPVTNVNYEQVKQKIQNNSETINILPPVTFRNDVNVTSCEGRMQCQPLSAEEALMTIKRRNFPKVLPDLPKSQKRLSLQPTTLQTFRSYYDSSESQTEKPKVPPQPPPRTTTLERRLAYRNRKLLSSFETPNNKNVSQSDACRNNNYENIDEISPYYDINKFISRSLETNKIQCNQTNIPSPLREYPKVIIASSDTPFIPETKIILKPSPSHGDIPLNTPRVRLPDDFHSASVSSFSSYSSDEDDEEISKYFDDEEDKLIQELVGGVESPTGMDVLDSKGPDTILKNIEIIPVQLNTVPQQQCNDNFICITDLYLPEVSGFEETARIKPNFGLNKLKNRSESINRPPERAMKVKHKPTIKPTNILGRVKSSSGSSTIKSNLSKLEHSTSGSSNDTETSTGTVKKI
ncbi:unnamed protein product [Leptidea sinapis]|uniref:Carboxylesterase type B domain-containing protein n=1 Tax=Leptidea sinapis TaxID=189913 RepID=A0A5E4R5E3_9NEOP|nr:unnamed protein product [Leptidea sinapis]